VKIAVEARHMALTDAMRQYVDSKVAKLPRYYDSILSIEVMLDVEADQPVVEIHVAARQKHTFVARHRDEDLYACVDQCVDKITRQLRRHKDRIRGHRPAPAEQIVAEGPGED
jgi:putative sigma-54 modulation protein